MYKAETCAIVFRNSHLKVSCFLNSFCSTSLAPSYAWLFLPEHQCHALSLFFKSHITTHHFWKLEHTEICQWTGGSLPPPHVPHQNPERRSGGPRLVCCHTFQVCLTWPKVSWKAYAAVWLKREAEDIVAHARKECTSLLKIIVLL